jgi:hypothetical protein
MMEKSNAKQNSQAGQDHGRSGQRSQVREEGWYTTVRGERVPSGRQRNRYITQKEEGLRKRAMDPVSPAEDLSDIDIDRLVPPKIMRITQHYHNLIYIRYFFESIGQQPPVWTKAEMSRVDKALQEELKREHGQGGRLRSRDETG